MIIKESHKILEDRIKYIEDEFNNIYEELRRISHPLIEQCHGFEEIDDVENESTEYWTHECFQRMYNIICVYFEMLNLPNYLVDFKENFGSIITDKKKAIEISSVPINYGDIDLDFTLLIQWKKYLAPFHFFWDKNENKKEIEKLIPIIKSTNEILKLTKTSVKKEEDINSIIREVLSLYYTDVKAYSQGYFRHKFEQYKPDVIIGEIGVALEYKLIRKDKDIGIKINELLIDAKRYTGNHHNNKCIAVFCLSKEVHITKKQIKEDWNNMEFPENWVLIIISDIEVI